MFSEFISGSRFRLSNHGCDRFLLMLNEELQLAMTLARRAGTLILGYYRDGFEVEEKIGADSLTEPVTIADREASRIIVEGLSEAFPEDGILSEEELDAPERTSKKRVWMIDPLDGTLGFINRRDDFAVQIGLTENGKSVMGVVYLPVDNVLYFASVGNGAFRVESNGETLRLQVTETTDFSKMVIALSANHPSPKMQAVKKALGVEKEIRRGSVGIKVGLLAARVADLYIHLSPRTKFWDTCAPQIILEEAGGKMTDIFGEEFRYDTLDLQNHNGLVATNGAAHENVIATLKPLLAEFGRLKVLKKNN